MSVLVFVDESRWQPAGKNDQFITWAGVAFDEIQYDEFCRKVLGLKNKFFKRGEIGDYPLQGRSLLCNRALESYRKVEFIRDLLSLCRLQHVVTFSNTRIAQSGTHGACRVVDHDLKGKFTSTRRSESHSRIGFGLDYLIERINSFMLEEHPGAMAKLVFQSESVMKDRTRTSLLMRLFYKTPLGGGFSSVLGSPLFVPALLSPGAQMADVFAYIINQHHGGRYQMNDFFGEVESMQYVSAFERDEYKLRGMNLSEC